MADYRLEELATRSGVSVRNIRAYRERGLLDAPRRHGRSAFYDDHHVAQLQTINDLLRKGFTSAHIAEFFATTRQGHDLADILGLQDAIFGRSKAATSQPLDIDPEGDEARELVARGLAELVDGAVTICDQKVAAIVSGATDQLARVRTVLRIAAGTAEPLEAVAAAVVEAWYDGVVARFGQNYVPLPEDMAELRQMVEDFRALGNLIVAEQLSAALQRHLVTATADYTTDIVVAGDWGPSDAQR